MFCISSELDLIPAEVTEGNNCSEAYNNDSCQLNVPSLFSTVIRALHPLSLPPCNMSPPPNPATWICSLLIITATSTKASSLGLPGKCPHQCTPISYLKTKAKISNSSRVNGEMITLKTSQTLKMLGTQKVLHHTLYKDSQFFRKKIYFDVNKQTVWAFRSNMI